MTFSDVAAATCTSVEKRRLLELVDSLLRSLQIFGILFDSIIHCMCITAGLIDY